MKITEFSKGLANKSAILLLLPYICIVAVITSTFQIYPAGDSQSLLIGLNNIFGCFAESPIKAPCYALHFPIFQYLIATPFKLAGLNDAAIIKVFGWINLAWSLLAAGVFWRVGNLVAARPGGHLAVLILLSGYMLWYMTSSFNEAGAFAFFALLMLSVIANWGIGLVCLIALGCTLTKEVAFPFVLYFMFVAHLAHELFKGRPLEFFKNILVFLRKYKFVFVSVLVGVIINLSFNYFRFGSIANLANLDPILFNPWSFVPIFFAFLFISPAGGLAFSWFSLSVLMLSPAIFFIRNRPMLLVSGLVIFGLVAGNLGLARWYSSFGWNAWGPRLTLPFLGAVGVLFVFLVLPPIIRHCQRIRYGADIVFLVIAISSLPNLAVRFDMGTIFTEMLQPAQVAINSGIPNFTVQTAPVPLYQEAAIEGYERNVVIPTTYKIILKNGVATLIWLGSVLYICRKYIIVHEQNEPNADSYKRAQRIFLWLAVFCIVFATVIASRNHREYCHFCFKEWQKYSLGDISSSYHTVPAQESLVQGLDNFPAQRPMAEIQLELKQPGLLKAISIDALGHKNANLGNWTTEPVPQLWGIGILSDASPPTVINMGGRIDNLHLAAGKHISLLIPDNDNLPHCPKLFIRLIFVDGYSAETLASCK